MRSFKTFLVIVAVCAGLMSSGQSFAQKKASETGYGTQNGIINGSFPFYQRGATDGTSGYGLDRWFATAGTLTRITANLPGGAKYGASLALTAASGYLCQRVEQMNALQYYGRTITFSGYARASAGSGALQIKIDRPNTIDSYVGVGKAGTTVTSEVAATNILATTSTSLQRFTYTRAASANMANYGFQVCLGNGSSTTTTYELSNIMLNTGDRAAPFALAGGTVGGELALAQRYYEKSYPLGSAPGTASEGIIIGATYPDNGDWATVGKLYAVRKRVSVTPVVYNSAGTVNAVSLNAGGTSITGCSASGNEAGIGYVMCGAGSFTTKGVFKIHFTADAEL